MSDRIDHAAEAVGLLALAVADQHQGDLILADAIYAAGQALHADACTEGDPHDGCDCGDWDREAEIAVRAALPSIEHQLRELIAQAIEALPKLSVSHFGTRPLPDLIRKDTAARIARGDASND